MSIKKFNNDLRRLEHEVSNYFSELLLKQKEIIIFEFEENSDDTPDDYLEMRNDVTGNVFDVHPLKINEFGIHVTDADGSGTRRLINLSNLGSIQDRINLCELMENNLVD